MTGDGRGATVAYILKSCSPNDDIEIGGFYLFSNCHLDVVKQTHLKRMVAEVIGSNKI